MARIVVLGGGFGGLAAAHRLKELRPDDTITVVDRNAEFYVGLVKLWDIVGLRSVLDAARPLENLRRHGIEFIRTDIANIDPATKTVHTGNGTLEADYLVIALGVAFSPEHTEQLGGKAHNLYDGNSLPMIRKDLEGLTEGRVLVAVLDIPYKCPPAPYEAAFLIDEWLRGRGRRQDVEMAVHTPQPSPLPIAGPEASARISATLAERNIALHTEHLTTSVDAAARTIAFEGGDVDEFSMLLAVPKHIPPEVVAGGPLAGKSGWIEPDPRTLATSFEGVYAVGDCTATPLAAGQLPKAGVFAERQAIVAAENIAADIEGREGVEFDGRGYCFLEFAERKAAYVEGQFFATPKPAVTVTPPSEETWLEKGNFASSRVEEWL